MISRAIHLSIFPPVLLLVLIVSVSCGYPGSSALSISSQGHVVYLARLHTEGADIKNEVGNVVLLHGVNFPGFCDGAAGAEWGHLYREQDYVNARSWGLNCIRLPFAKVFWDEGEYGGKTTKELIDDQVEYARNHFMYLIIDCHGEEPPMGLPSDWDAWVDMWVEIANRYKDESHVLFELLNEPRAPLTANQWIQHAQDAVDAIRATGAENIVVVDGWNWANELTPFITNPISDDNFVYTAHTYKCYNWGIPEDYNGLKAYLSSAPIDWYYFISNDLAPVICTEFGVLDSYDGQGEFTWYENLLTIMNEWAVGYTAWAWIEPRGEFELLASDWITPSPSGEILIEYLGGEPGSGPPTEELPFSSGFETETNEFNVEWDGVDTTGAGSTAEVETSNPHCGVRNAKFTAVGTDGGATGYKTFSSEPIVHFRGYYKFNNLPDSDGDILFLHQTMAGTWQNSIEVIIQNNGGVYRWGLVIWINGVGTFVYESSPSNPSIGQYYCIESMRDVTNNEQKLWINGNLEVSATQSISGNNSRVCAGITTKDYSGTDVCYVDCCVVSDTYIGEEG